MSLFMTGVMVPVNAHQSPTQSALLDVGVLNNSAGYEAPSAAETENRETSTETVKTVLSESAGYKIVPVKDSPQKTIVVFDFELIDQSAGGGVVAKDAIDIENLKLSTRKARSMLADSGRYSIVDTSSTIDEIVSAGGIKHCDGCEAPLAKRLGADQSLIGIISRINRTEYTLQILIRDSQTGAILSNDFTGLRMGANYAWPRGVKWLMKNKILATQ
ncbi:MAG: DUF3280 domain-containing protein [Candidatus Thiodiazotropha sp.]